MTELIPLHTWHLRRLHHLDTPVLDLPWAYQHRYQLHKYLRDRDNQAETPSNYWQTTAIEFMHAIHPLPGVYRSTYWHAARRSTRIFDWVGHGRNQAKLLIAPPRSPPNLPVCPLCSHCGLIDDQAHTLLQCTLPALTPIRLQAKRLQSFAASLLRKKHNSAFDRHIIDQILVASWATNSTHTRRIWLGMWSPLLLQDILSPSFPCELPMSTPDRYKYRKIIRKLTFPLIFAYRQMLKLYRPLSSHPTIPPALPGRLRHRTSLLLPQQPSIDGTASLSHQQSYLHPHAFTLSDAANSIIEPSIGLYRIIS
jgi:hypothetical protein